MPEFVKNIKKTYTNYVKYIEYQRAWTPSKQQKNKRMNVTESRLKQLRSGIRARTAIYDIAQCNEFEYFVTLTFSPDAPLDRYNYDDCAKYLSKWLNNHLTHYLAVPEKHKDGAYHFHLLADIPKNKLKHHHGGMYNITSYTYGFSNVTKVKDPVRLSRYITKYITKDLMDTVGKGRKTYWTSRDLKRPEKEYNVRIPVHATPVFTTDTLTVYQCDS